MVLKVQDLSAVGLLASEPANLAGGTVGRSSKDASAGSETETKAALPAYA